MVPWWNFHQINVSWSRYSKYFMFGMNKQIWVNKIFKTSIFHLDRWDFEWRKSYQTFYYRNFYFAQSFRFFLFFQQQFCMLPHDTGDSNKKMQLQNWPFPTLTMKLHWHIIIYLIPALLPCCTTYRTSDIGVKSWNNNRFIVIATWQVTFFLCSLSFSLETITIYLNKPKQKENNFFISSSLSFSVCIFIAHFVMWMRVVVFKSNHKMNDKILNEPYFDAKYFIRKLFDVAWVLRCKNFVEIWMHK